MSCLFGGWPAEFLVDAEHHPVLPANAPEVLTASLVALRKVAAAPCLHQIFFPLGVIDAIFNLSLSNITNKKQLYEDHLQTYLGMDQVNAIFSATGQLQCSCSHLQIVSLTLNAQKSLEKVCLTSTSSTNPPQILYVHVLRPCCFQGCFPVVHGKLN